MQALIELVRTKVDYLVQESVKVIKDILRRYPNRYESIIKDFCDNLKALNFADERAAMIWIVGEYADKISNSVMLIESFAENFKEEAVVVQHAILTAAVKIYLKLGEEGEEMIVDILKLATEEAENPDLRNRGYVYWRMLTSDPDLAKELILEEKPIISDQSENLDPSLLDSLIAYLGTLYSINQKPPSKAKIVKEKVQERFDLEEVEEVEVEVVEDSTGVKRTEYKGETDVQTFNDLIGLGDDEEAKKPVQSESDLFDEMLGLSPTTPPQSKVKTDNDDFTLDLLGDDIVPKAPPKSLTCRVPEKTLIKETDTSKNDNSGLELRGSFQRVNDKLVLELTFKNHTSFESIHEFAIKFNKNSFGLQPSDPIPDFTLAPEDSHKVSIGIDVNENNSNKAPGTPITVDCAMRTSLGIYVFSIPVMLSVLLAKQSTMVNVKDMRELWKQIETQSNMYYTVPNLSLKLTSPQLIKERLLDNNIVFLEEGRNEEGHPCLYFTAKTTNNLMILLQLTFKDGDCTLCIKSKVAQLIPLTQQAVSFILS